MSSIHVVEQNDFMLDSLCVSVRHNIRLCTIFIFRNGKTTAIGLGIENAQKNVSLLTKNRSDVPHQKIFSNSSW